MAIRIPSLWSARPVRELQVATRCTSRAVGQTRRHWLAPVGLALAFQSCAGQLPVEVELDPLVPTYAPSLAERLAGMDIAHIDLYGGVHSDGDQRIATLEGSMDAIVVEADGGSRNPVDTGYSLGGESVRLSFDYGPLMFDGAGAQVDAKRVTVEIAWIAAPPFGPAQAAIELLSALDPGDRATVWIHEPSLGQEPAYPERLGLSPMLLHAQHMRDLVAAAEAEALAAIPAGAPFADSGAVSIPEAAHEDFLEFCEAELLVRRGSDAALSHAAPADAWFGGVVRLKGDPEGTSLRSLAAVMHRLFLERLETVPPTGWDRSFAEQLHSPSASDEWALPRFMLLREMMGATEFRALLRTFVDEHRSGAPVGWEEFATAAEAAAPDFGARFVRSWLRNSTEPRVKIRWTHDEARGRILLRVDQIHELQGGAAAPVFPFHLPVRMTSAAGEVSDHLLGVNKRRDVLNVLVPDAPAKVEIDPDGRLRDLMTIESFDANPEGLK